VAALISALLGFTGLDTLPLLITITVLLPAQVYFEVRVWVVLVKVAEEDGIRNGQHER
jgi:hypothetical protein